MQVGYTVIHHVLTFGRRIPELSPEHVQGRMTYDSRDPYAVSISFAGSEVAWLCGRELLVKGMTEVCGDGNVRIIPVGLGRRMLLQLSSSSRTTFLAAPTSEVAAFLGRTYGVVPSGHESRFIDFDAELAKLSERE